jgi:tight adherence protein B
MRRLAAALLLIAVALGLLASPAPAKSGKARLTPVPGPGFLQRSFVLTLPASRELGPTQVKVTENGRPVSRLSVTPAHAVGEKRFAVVLVIDASRSMRGSAIRNAMAAARAFAARRNPGQQLAAITFNRKAVVVLPLTADKLAIDSTLSRLPALGGGTHLYDAVAQALVLLKQAQITAGSVVLLSDGSDTGSQVSEQEVAATARAAGVRVFTVGLRSGSFDSGPLRSLAAGAHGDYSEARSAGDLGTIYAGLGSKLASQYLIKYRSLASRGSAVHVEVRTAGVPGLATSDYATPPLNSASGPAPGHPRGFWSSPASMVVISLACAILIGLCMAALLARRLPRTETLGERLQGFVTSPSRESAGVTQARVASRVLVGAERSLEKTRWWATFKEELDVARIKMPAIQIVALTGLGTVVAMWLLAVVTGAGLFALLGLAVPLAARAIIKHRLEAQRKLFADQLADNLQVIASAMRAGHSFVGALSIAVEDSPEPTRTEFRRVVADENLGVQLEETLGVVARRMESDDLGQTLLVAMLQRETGGNMAEVIDRIADTIRERAELRRIVHTLTAQGRMSRWVVTALPVALLLIITAINPSYMKPLYVTSTGHTLLVLAAFMLVIGSLVIKRIVDFKV